MLRTRPQRGVLRLGLTAALCAFSATAAAQPAATLNRFRPAATPEDDFHLSRPTDLGHLRFGAHLLLDYGMNPLVYEEVSGDASTERFSVVEHQLVGTVGVALGLFDRAVVFGGLPVGLMLDGADSAALLPFDLRAADGAGLGDAFLGARVRLFGESSDPLALALQVRLTFPTSGVPEASSYRGDPSVTFLPELLAEVRPGYGIRIVANVGARVREETSSQVSNLEFGHELTYGLGLAVPVWTDADPGTHLDVHAQVYGDSTFALLGERNGTALEATAGLRLFHQSGLIVGAAAGPGLARGFGSPDVRVIAQIGWAMPAASDGDRDGDGILDSRDACPDEPEDLDGYQDEDGCPDPDNDGDGIPDVNDACPNEPETVNDFEDTDGCPDEVPDTDGDGLRDDVDQCPSEPEDVDGHQDEDGCPDPDNDGDGVLDVDDRCPLEPGPASNQGCPIPDRDGDTVPDAVDNCPDEPGLPEHQGCQAPQRVTLTADRLDILEAVFFRTNAAEILARSFPLLENVATVLQSHPEIELVIVEGHTDSRGGRARNVTLSQQRAEAVARFLVERGGVAPERLQARGFGPDRPRVENARTPDQHAQNRRVEFNIPNAGAGIRQGESEAASDTIDR